MQGDIQFWVYVSVWDEAAGAYGPARRVHVPATVCAGADQPGLDPRVAVIAQVRRDWQDYPIPRAVVRSQPAAGTLAGAVTRFAGANQVVVVLAPRQILGFEVRVTVVARSFTWRFGDGAVLSQAPSDAPAAEHVYRTVGAEATSLEVSYTGSFQIVGSPDVYQLDGTAQVPGQDLVLTVDQARTQLEGGGTG